MDVRLSEWRGGIVSRFCCCCSWTLVPAPTVMLYKKKRYIKILFLTLYLEFVRRIGQKKNMKKRPKNLLHNIAGITVHCRVQHLDVGNHLLYL